MALSPEDKKKYSDMVERTGGNRAQMLAGRTIPADYQAYLDQVQRREQILEFEGIMPVRVVVSTSKQLAEHAPIHVNMHGGGFWFRQNEDDDMYCAHIATETHGVVVDIDYATSPDYPFPTAFEQSYAVTRWAGEHARELGADPARLSVGGLSAGGCLSAAISLRAAAAKEFGLCLQVLDCAAIDNMAAVENWDNDRTYAFSMMYCGGDSRLLKSPYCSPAYANDAMLANNPKTLVVNAGHCPFKKANERYAMRLASQGTEASVKCFTESRHVFTVRMVDQWREAQDLIIRYIKESSL